MSSRISSLSANSLQSGQLVTLLEEWSEPYPGWYIYYPKGRLLPSALKPLSPLNALKVKVNEWDRMIDVNIRGVLHGIAAVLPGMEARGKGQVINVSSIGGHSVSPTAAVYCATKYAVCAISDGLRQETDQIRVTVISPGVVESELADSISDPSARDAMKAFRRIAIQPDAIARAIGYAIEQPDDVDVSEVIVRPTASPF